MSMSVPSSAAAPPALLTSGNSSRPLLLIKSSASSINSRTVSACRALVGSASSYFNNSPRIATRRPQHQQGRALLFSSSSVTRAGAAQHHHLETHAYFYNRYFWGTRASRRSVGGSSAHHSMWEPRRHHAADDASAAASGRSAATTRAQAAESPVEAPGPAPVCVITGGSRGIGKAILLQLAAAGCRVAVFDLPHSAEAGLTAVDEATQAGAEDAIFVSGSVSKQADVQALMDTVAERWKQIDVLVNNAGITRDGLMIRMKAEDWQQVLDVNLNGTFLCSQAAIRLMSKQKSGRIVNISSVVGLHGNPGQANYSASKAAIIGLTKTAAREYASRGIKVNAVAPGFIETEMTSVLTDTQKSKLLSHVPAGRMGHAGEVAGVVRFLALDPAAEYINGQVVVVDGGMTM